MTKTLLLTTTFALGQLSRGREDPVSLSVSRYASTKCFPWVPTVLEMLSVTPNPCYAREIHLAIDLPLTTTFALGQLSRGREDPVSLSVSRYASTECFPWVPTVLEILSVTPNPCCARELPLPIEGVLELYYEPLTTPNQSRARRSAVGYHPPSDLSTCQWKRSYYHEA